MVFASLSPFQAVSVFNGEGTHIVLSAVKNFI